jgi:site-specific DNA-methyltransferase (adenine-specific)
MEMLDRNEKGGLKVNSIYQGNCLDLMKYILDKSVDMILCDLPYGTTACEWDTIIPFEPLWEQYTRIIKNHGAIVLTASQPFTSALVMSNVTMFRYEWVWEKSHGGGFLNANRQPLKRHENILVFSSQQSVYKPQKTIGKAYTCRSSAAGETTQDQTVAGWITKNNGDRYPLSYIYIKSETGLHPTQKPIALGQYLIRTYTNAGDLVLDNCTGSGSFCVAAKLEKRNFIGIEKEEKYCVIARKRLKEIDKKEIK